MVVQQRDGPRRLRENDDDDDTIRYDTRCYFNVRSKADISQLNLPHDEDDVSYCYEYKR